MEIQVKSCNECLQSKHKPAEAPLYPWEFPGRSWSRLHIDYAGSVQGKMILVIVDSYSKWIEAHVVTTATATATINKLRLTFATHGLPDIIVSDNGANFTSEEFAAFMKSNGIKHVRTAPYHPASNGQAERVIQTVIERLRKLQGETLEIRLAKVLFHRRLTPNTTTGRSPAELLMNRQLKSRPLDLIRPDVRRKVKQKQEEQKFYHDRQVKERNFGLGESVAVENHSKLASDKWIPAVVISKTGPVSYVVETHDEQKLRRHIDQILPWETTQLDGKHLDKNATLVPKSVPGRINGEQRRYPERNR